MAYTDRIQADLKDAMLKKESDRVRTLRMLISKLREKKIEAKKDLEEKDEIAVLKKAAKERKDSLQTYEKAGRSDLASEEKKELEIIQEYLPAEMSEEAVEAIVKEAIAEVGAASISDMGPVMGASMKKIAGRADGKRVQSIVKKLLGA
ncbi:MAG: GatB/YqeY domain-containing protein [Candidatus Marinimicrobia bacterium]|nr:GatB/YqeY domain-containing protein [Candidatus Neomarinimicrobiota bacterium]